jgi:hypothetical protein
MAPLMLLNNFIFFIFFGGQIPIKGLIPPISSVVSSNVLESNNIGEQITFPHAPKLQSSSLEIFVVDPDPLLETIVIDVDDECVPPPKKPK